MIGPASAARFRGGQSGRIELPREVRDSGADAEYTFVQLADPQLGMLRAMQRVQWQRPLLALATCGRVRLPPRLEVEAGAWELLAPGGSNSSGIGGGCSGAIGTSRRGAEDDGAQLDALEVALAARTVEAVNGLNPPPAFVVVCGDLVNAFPSSPSSSGGGGGGERAAQVAAFRRTFSGLRRDVALVCVCGNHDVGERPTPATLAAWRDGDGRAGGDGNAAAGDGDVAGGFGKDRFAFQCGPDRYVVLNSQLFQDGSGAPLEAAAQEAWLAEALLAEALPEAALPEGALPEGALPEAALPEAALPEAALPEGALPEAALPEAALRDQGPPPPQPRWTAVFSHIPPFIRDPGEPDGYFALPRPVRRRLLRRAARAGCTHWFAGHYHRNAGGTFLDDDDANDDEGSGGNGGGGECSGGRGGGRGRRSVEVVTTAAVGGNLTTCADDGGLFGGGDPLGLSGMDAVVASPRLSGFRLVTVGPRGLAHRFVALSERDGGETANASRPWAAAPQDGEFGGRGSRQGPHTHSAAAAAALSTTAGGALCTAARPSAELAGVEPGPNGDGAVMGRGAEAEVSGCGGDNTHGPRRRFRAERTGQGPE